MTEDTARYGKS